MPFTYIATASTHTRLLAYASLVLSFIRPGALPIILLLILTLLISCKSEKTRRIELTLHPLEALATRHGPKIVVLINGKSAGKLSAKNPKLRVSLAGKRKLKFVYIGPRGEATDVAWSETVNSKNGSFEVLQPWRRPDRETDWHVLVWARPEDRIKVLKHLPKAVTVVSPIWWTIDKLGAVRKDADPELVTVLRNEGIAVWPAIQGLDTNGLHEVLGNDSLRSQVATLVAGEAKSLGAQGVNIDIEGFRVEDSDAAVAFVRELAGLVHAWGGIVSYDVVPRSDTWESLPVELSYWSNAVQRRRLASAVDYTILMAYDQFNQYRPAGPVAAPNWVEEVLIYLLRYADPQSVMLGIPAYGRIWNPRSLDAPRAVSLSQLDGRDGRPSFDKTHCVDRIVRPDALFYWAEDEVADKRLELALDYKLAGVAIWRRGLDYPKLWRTIRALEQAHFSLFGKFMGFLLGRLSHSTGGWASCPNMAD